MKKLLILLLVLPLCCFAQHSISGTFTPASDYTYAFLYKATPNGVKYIDRAELDSLGQFSIALKPEADTGVYKLVYAIPPEENNFDIIYNGKENIDLSFSANKGLNFKTSSENKLWDSYLHSMDMVNQTISNYYTKGGTDQAGFNSIFKTLKETQNSYEELAKGTFVEVFITSNRPYIPEAYEDISTYSNNLKNSYFDHVNFESPLLRSSSFITDRINNFVFGLASTEDNTTYKSHIEIIAKAITGFDASIQAPIMELLWLDFVQLDNHDIANFIADSYLLTLAQATSNIVLEQQIKSYKNLSIGTVAPDFEIQSVPTLKLSELQGKKYYILIFWSSGCSHCLNELPKVKTLVQPKTDTQVVAFGLENEALAWEKQIQKYPEFIHGIGLGKWNHPMVQTYAIAGTPTYFVLDANKTIIAKPYDFEALEKFFDTL